MYADLLESRGWDTYFAGAGHVTGCELFPLPTDAFGCDAEYDLGNLGSYGVQYWLHSSWASGFLNIGIGCAPPTVAEWWERGHAGNADRFRGRFVSGIPPVAVVGEAWGGGCPAS